ncbi:NUDIX domain-containing protein [Catellatospora chokoriensis]|uniref:ADP-ribose pyrophosphatase n=1 Tax=Catellatospora chokoriensis TaxID=310353 RepID=A0A8J3NRV3_9ACTN|nr:NUDIX hydrolase [Catellatospora chokoriensis]GIF89891.1 ADP-ribose pyrophosphatase [Catellatospora chokoriensis]
MYEVVGSTERFKGHIFRVVTDQVTMPGGGVAGRDVVRHVGAVGVVALDDAGRVVLVRQYRHPVGRYLWELPAGLIDVQGEGLAAAALRELAEEADLTAGRVDLLVDMFTTPGCSDEMIRVFLARDLVEAPERHVRTDEEADMQVDRVPLDDAVAMIFDGRITNGPAVGGLLAAARARDTGFKDLRPADAPLPPR